VADSTIGTRLLNQKEPEPTSSAPAPAATASATDRLDLCRVAYLDNANLLTNRLCRRLDFRSLSVGFDAARIDQHGNSARLGDKLAKQLKALTANRARNENYSRNVAARPVEARHEAVPDRIAAGGEHDRYRRGRRLGSDRRQSVADNHRGPACDYFGG
jgi:hypothetical protein